METDNNAPSKLLPGEMVSSNVSVKFRVNKISTLQCHICNEKPARGIKVRGGEIIHGTYRGVGQTRTMEIGKKPSGLPRLVRITPTVWITEIVPKTDFSFDIPDNFFLQKI